jgi:2-dehydro-3-deoxyphosphogluconate aldolase/(4S)-4-hydroxy-2-oxoglutarate aldolase
MSVFAIGETTMLVPRQPPTSEEEKPHMGWSDDWFEKEFAATQVLVILRGHRIEGSLGLATRAWDAGVRAVEIPIQRPEDVTALGIVAAAAERRGLTVGAGTVVRVEQVEQARRAGAAYTVSPGTDEAVIEASLDAGLPTLPGVATASEVQRCARLDLAWLKAFPAVVLGPDWIRAMLGPFPGVSFVATGGMTVDNSGSFVAAGARAVALGSGLGDPARLASLAVRR